MAMSQETKIRRKEERAYEKRMSALKSIAYQSIVLPEMGVAIKGLVRDVNPALEKLGYRPIRITSNMLNPDSKKFAIDINTPDYCDPGCESYHSM